MIPFEKKTYVIDIDGTVASHEKDYATAIPFKGRIKKVNELYDQGHTIIYDTARGSGTGIDWREVTERQLKLWGCKYHVLRVGEKLEADFFVDDKAINDNDFFGEPENPKNPEFFWFILVVIIVILINIIFS